VAVGGNTSYLSSDGVSWTSYSVPNGNNALGNVVYSPELNLYCATLLQTNPNPTYVLTSQDGITWTSRTVPVVVDGLVDVAWSSTLQKFIVVGGGAININFGIESNDGITWTSFSTPLGNIDQVIWSEK
jgi:hypothetical protein